MPGGLGSDAHRDCNRVRDSAKLQRRSRFPDHSRIRVVGNRVSYFGNQLIRGIPRLGLPARLSKVKLHPGTSAIDIAAGVRNPRTVGLFAVWVAYMMANSTSDRAAEAAAGQGERWGAEE